MEHESFKTWLWVNKSRPVGNLTDDEILRYADEYARGKAGLASARIAELERENESLRRNEDRRKRNHDPYAHDAR